MLLEAVADVGYANFPARPFAVVVPGAEGGLRARGGCRPSSSSFRRSHVEFGRGAGRFERGGWGRALYYLLPWRHECRDPVLLACVDQYGGRRVDGVLVFENFTQLEAKFADLLV